MRTATPQLGSALPMPAILPGNPLFFLNPGGNLAAPPAPGVPTPPVRFVPSPAAAAAGSQATIGRASVHPLWILGGVALLALLLR